MRLVPGTSVSVKLLHLQTGKPSEKLSDKRKDSNGCDSRRSSLRMHPLLVRQEKPAGSDSQKQDRRCGLLAAGNL